VVKEKMCSIAGSGVAADVTGMSRVCNDILSRLEDFIRRVDAIKDNVTRAHECFQLIDKVLINYANKLMFSVG